MHVFSCKILYDISYKILQELPCKITKEFGTYPGVILPYLYVRSYKKIMHDIARIVCHDLTYKYGKITPGYVPNSLVILHGSSCRILYDMSYTILQGNTCMISQEKFAMILHINMARSHRDMFQIH